MAKHYLQDNNELHMEELEVGDTVITISRTISASEVEHFAIITGDPLPQFLSRQRAQKQGFRDQVVPGYLTLSLAAGLRHHSGLTSHVIAFMGMDKMRLIAPVYVGDAIRVQHQLLDKKPTRRPGRVICIYKWQILNQDGKTVAEGENT